MTLPIAYHTSIRLEAVFGLGRSWKSQDGASATVWETQAYHLLWSGSAASGSDLRRL